MDGFHFPFNPWSKVRIDQRDSFLFGHLSIMNTICLEKGKNSNKYIQKLNVYPTLGLPI